jgi:hypothetical protein
MKLLVNPRLVLSVVAGAFLASFSGVSAQQTTAAVAIDADDIGGVVTSAKGRGVIALFGRRGDRQ